MKRTCVAIVDAAHARFFRYTRDEDGRTELQELVDRVSPGRQAHGRFTERPSRGAGNGAGIANTHDDHRADHLAEADTRFAREVVAELSEIVAAEGFMHLIVVASPKMLGRLRVELAPLRRGVSIDELPQDLTRLTSPQVHDHLAALHLIDPRPGAQLRVR